MVLLRRPKTLLALLLVSPAATQDGDGAGPILRDEEAQKRHDEATIGSSLHAPLELNRFTFERNVLRAGERPVVAHWVIKFCLPWWQPCQPFAQVFDELGAEWQGQLNHDLLTKELRFATVDCATDKVLCNEQDVDQYPSVMHYTHGEMKAKWIGGQKKNPERFQKWLKSEFGGLRNATTAEPEGFATTLANAFPRERAADVFLIIVGVLLSVRLVLSSPDLFGRPKAAERSAGAAQQAPQAGSEAEVVAEPAGGAARRNLPADWATSRGSVEM